MIKVKDGYGKLIGTTYQGSATQVLLSNGGNLEFSSGTKANTLVQRNANQHVYATYFNSAISDEALTDIGSVYVRNTSDTFIRRISKTQFYSIIDNKFVTLDTAQTITGVKTFSTGPILAINATITQNQSSTSNYTTVVKWLKGGTSQGTYNPSIGQHNTGGDGTGSICILPYPTNTDPWNGTVGLFISKGVLRLDGRAVAIAENYYTKTESDNRYVNVTGDTMTGPLIVKASITGTQLISNIADGTAPLKVTSKTVVTNLNSDLLDGNHASKFYENGYTMFGYTINASSLNVNTYYPVTFNIGASSNVRIECRVALNSGTKPSWSTHANGFSVRKIWEVNGSGWGTNPVNRRILVSDYAFVTADPVRGVGQLTNSSVEYVYVRGGGKYYFYTSHNISPVLRTSTYTTNSQSVAPTTSAPAAIYRNVAYTSEFVSSLGTSGNYLTWVKNGATNNIIIPYATNADKLDGFHANTSQNPFGKIPTIGSDGVMEVGRYLDFHYNSSDTSDYRTRLQINHSSGSYTAILPAKSGTLAMTSDIPTVTNYYWANVKVSSSSNTSTSPTFSTAYTSNWFRSNGQTGWYSQTYGGGIYMTDSSYVRVYGGKRFYAASGYLSPYSGSSWISMATRTNCIVADQNNSASSAHALFRVKNSSGHAIAFGGLGANIGFYGFYASRISSGANGIDWSTVWNVGTGIITHSKTIYTAGYYHSSVNSNNYVLLAGGSYKNLADFAKGNAGSSTQGVYVTSGTVKAMTYSLKATVNSGSSGKLAYYSGTNSIDDYTSTKGSSSTPIYLNAGVPTACSGVIVKYWGWYNINCYSGTTPTYSKKGGNFNFVTSISRRSEGKYTLGTVYPSGYTYNNTIYWGSGKLNKGMSSNSSNSILYVTMFNGYQSGSTYYLYVNTADDSSTNDGVFEVFFLCF